MKCKDDRLILGEQHVELFVGQEVAAMSRTGQQNHVQIIPLAGSQMVGCTPERCY